MNNYYMAHLATAPHRGRLAARARWQPCASTLTTEFLGGNLIDAVMTLIAFLPVLLRFSADITELPLLGSIPHSLVIAALLWSFFGTAFLAAVGIKLPGLDFRNQRVRSRLSQGTRRWRGRTPAAPEPP